MLQIWPREIALWLLSIFIVALNAGFGIFNVRRMVDSERLLLQTRMTCAELSAVKSDVVDAETAQRGYLLTGRSEYLEPFHHANELVWNRLAALHERFTPESAQQRQVDEIEKKIREKFDEMQHIVEIYNAEGRIAASLEVSGGHGKRLMDQIRQQSSDLLDYEESVLIQRAELADYHYRAAELTTILGAALSIAVLTIVAIIVVREMRTRRLLSQSLANSKSETEKAFAQLEALVQTATHGIAFFNSDLRYLRVNTVFAQANELEIAQHFGRKLSEVIPDYPASALEEYMAVLRGGAPVIRHVVKLNERLWEISAFPVPTDGTELGLGMIGLDITEKEQAQQRLKESEERFRTIAETMPQIIWKTDRAGQLNYVNAQWQEFTGQSVAELQSSGLTSALHPDDLEKSNRAWQQSLQSGHPYEMEQRLQSRDGDYRWFLVRAVAVRDASGQIILWLGSHTNMDDRKRQSEILEGLVDVRTAALVDANLELTRQQAFVDAILQNVEEGIVACDAAGNLQLFNAATVRMHGLPAEPLSSERWAEHYNLYESDGVTPMPMDRVPLYRAWRGEVVQDWEMVIHPKRESAKPKFVLCSGQQLRTPDGELFGAVVSMRDMTVRRDYERQLMATANALKTSNEDLEKFAYVASHDLQEPLRKIQAFGDRLLKKCRDELGEQGQNYVDRMLESAGRMRKLIDDLLAFSRIGTKLRNFEPVGLNDVVQGVLSDLDDQILRTKATVHVGWLPTLAADPVQLRQLFQNLIGNAMKFTRDGQHPLVHVESQELLLGWRICVSDHGIGFDPKHAGRIFELFQRLHGRSEYEGTGLGLAIVKKIVTRHGGTIRAESQPGEGARFIIDWPKEIKEPEV